MTLEKWTNTDQSMILQALDTALLSFARWDSSEAEPSWILSGSKAFR